MILFLLLIFGCTPPDFTVFKQNFKNVASNEVALKTLAFAAKELDFQNFKESDSGRAFIKKVKGDENIIVKSGDSVELSKEIILIVCIYNGHYIFKPVIKKEISKVQKKANSKKLYELEDSDLGNVDVKFSTIESEDDIHITELIDKIRKILTIKDKFNKLKESELSEEERKAFPNLE